MHQSWKQLQDSKALKAKDNNDQLSNRRKILAVTTQIKQLRKESVKKSSGLNGIRTHDLCDVDAVLYQLSYQANLELVILNWNENLE